MIRTGLLLVFSLVFTTFVSAETAIEYTVSFEGRKNHYLEVEARIPTDGADTTELMMAVWTPGSYLVREYARHVEEPRALATDGSVLEFSKVRKNRWIVRTAGYSHLILKYRLYCREMTVRSNWVESGFAMLNGAPTFITRADALTRTHDVKLVLPEDWAGSHTGLDDHESGRKHHYRARDFDTLVDCPILAGNPTVHEFEVSGTSHFLINQDEAGKWDGQRSADDVKKIVQAQVDFWGVVPYDRYLFLNMIVETGGGLEHKNSTLMMTSRWNTAVREKYIGWLGLVSHEFFHTWNVKRLRPVTLGPFDYENENYTRSLWFAEGVTSYYDDLFLRRAGITTPKEYLEALSRQIDRLQTTPGRHVHSLSDCSYDAWIKFYRRDENTPNTTISYYTKGAVVAFLLDAHIRRTTKGERSLDHVLRRMYQRYSGTDGFTPDDFRETASEVAGVDLSDWLAHTLDGTKELDYSEAMDWYGLRFVKQDSDEDGDDEEKDKKKEPEDEKAPEDPKPGWLGLRTKNTGGKLVVTQIRRETPGHDAGFQVDDEIIAIGEFRVTAGNWDDRMKRYPPGTAAKVLVARRQKLITIDVTFAEEPEDKWDLEFHPDATDGQKARRRKWLGL